MPSKPASVMSLSLLSLLLTCTAYGAPTDTDSSVASWPARYRDASSGAPFFLLGLGGPPNYANIPIQAIDGQLLFSPNGKPQVVCPCSSDFGAKNYTGYWYGTGNSKDQNAGFQLFTNSLGEQTIYVDTNLQLKYTQPGLPIPLGANSSSISFYVNEPLGDGLGSPALLSIRGHVTHLDGSKTYYNDLQFCPAGSGAGSGAMTLYAVPVPADDQTENANASPGCTVSAVFTSTDTPAAAPYYFPFYTPQEPLVWEYL